ncbi:hypothetical protein E2C01_008232 [Portunus trituberculatus]|uniref:Uncharacterized protein n=1 Tax=Portunus trituberculatus TaxID=210409 RepID=A0A5B7D1A5_PORTR|nr:hypothetical protein [Portunus trituberculatus]
MHRLGMSASPHCLWCPTQPDTPEHLLLLYCPHHHSCHHSQCVALLHSLTALQPHTPNLTSQAAPSIPSWPSKTLNLTRTFLHKSTTFIATNLKL